jgi:carbonic anhydrase/acetyltransferase-like protein (isoleucine patch superfamily)
MDVRAILVVGSPADSNSEQFAACPLALLDVLGQSPALRLAERLRSFGVDAVTVLFESGHRSIPPKSSSRPWLRSLEVEPGSLWRNCEEIFSDYAQDGAEVVLVQRLGPYLELHYEELLQYHLDKKGRVTRVVNPRAEQLDAFVISASRRNDAAFLFRHQLQACRSECVDYVFHGYANDLRSPADLRQLGRDGLFQTNGVAPVGRQLRPGIWVGTGARVERGARLVAPCFIGERAKVRTAAVVTRGSALERYAEADCGSVVEDSSLLPFAKLGPGLDCSQAVAGFERLAYLPRAVEIEIFDPRLLTVVSPSPARRASTQAIALVGFVARSLPALFRSAASEVPRAAESDAIAPEVQSSIEKMRSARREESSPEPTFDKVRSLLHL